MNTSSSRIADTRAREQVSLQFQTSDDARRARARGASALRVAGPRRDRIPAWDVPCGFPVLGMSFAGVPALSLRAARCALRAARCAGDGGRASFCVAPACPLPDVPPGGGRSADEPASYALSSENVQKSLTGLHDCFPTPPRHASPGARESRSVSSFRRVTMRAGHGLAARMRSVSLAPASYALACPGRRGVRCPGGIRCLPSHHCSAMPSHALALASSASPAPPVPSPPCSKLRIERGRRRKRSRPGWRCAPPPPPAAATRTEGGNAP
jgi:hypothetical protein